MLQGIGMAVVALGIIGLIWGIFQKLKAGRVSDAPLVKTGDAAARGMQVAGPKGAISAEGNVVCQQPLVSPVTGTPCLFYELKVTASWKDGETTKEKELTHEKQAAQFAIDDGSGPVWVDARGGGDFEPTQRKEETKGTGLLGGITGQDIAFGNYRISTGMLSMGTKYTVKEEVLPIQQRMYVCGKAADGGGTITSPSWRQLIMSNKSRDELLASATQGAKMFLIGGGAAFAAGAAMAIIGSLLGGGDGKTASAAEATTAAAEAPAGGAGAAQAADGTKPATNKAAAVTKPGSTGAAAPATAGAATGAAATAGATAKPAASGAATAAPAATATPASTAKPAASGAPKAGAKK